MNSTQASCGFREWPAIARPVTDIRPSADGLGPRLAPNKAPGAAAPGVEEDGPEVEEDAEAEVEGMEE